MPTSTEQQIKFIIAHTKDVEDEQNRLVSLVEKHNDMFEMLKRISDYSSSNSNQFTTCYFSDNITINPSDIVVLIVWFGFKDELKKVVQQYGLSKLFVYQCISPLPSNIDSRQFESLKTLLNQLKMSDSATIVEFNGILELEEKFKENLVDIFYETIQAQFPQFLRGCLINYKKSLRSDRLIERIIVEQCEDLARYIQDLESFHLTKISTQILYKTILDSLTRFNKVDIIDQDIWRWDELIDEDGRTMFTFNYSREILLKTTEHARANKDYRLRRLFIVRESDIKEDPHKINKIITTIEEYIQDTTLQIENRFYLIKSKSKGKKPADHRDERDIKNLKDVVVVRSDDDEAILREDITYDQRQDARQSKSEISVKSNEIVEVTQKFDRIFERSQALSELKSILEKEDR